MKGARQLSDEEIRKIAKGFSGKYAVRNRTLFILGLACGGRISELLSLKIGDVWQYGKPVDTIYFEKQNTKGKRQGRAVPIKEAGKDAIRELVQWYKKRLDTIEDDMPLFTSQKGGGITRQQAHDILKEAFEKAEVSGKVSTHSLRKTYAHKLLKRGGDLHTVKEALGHTSIGTTQEYRGLDYDKFLEATPDYEIEKSDRRDAKKKRRIKRNAVKKTLCVRAFAYLKILRVYESINLPTTRNSKICQSVVFSHLLLAFAADYTGVSLCSFGQCRPIIRTAACRPPGGLKLATSPQPIIIFSRGNVYIGIQQSIGQLL